MAVLVDAKPVRITGSDTMVNFTGMGRELPEAQADVFVQVVGGGSGVASS